ncbi:unnamed protein product, partial [Tetraodon nigroviridis]
LHPRPDGVLVVPGRRGHLLLLHRAPDAPAQHLLQHQSQEARAAAGAVSAGQQLRRLREAQVQAPP